MSDYKHVFENGNLDGEYRMWYIDGTIKTRDFYKNGSREIHRSWYKNGRLMEETFYRDDKTRIGKWRSFHENGNPVTQIFYQEGTLEGERRYWRVDGCLTEREFYSDGNLIDSKFTLDKKMTFIHLKGELISQISGSYNLSNFLIGDLFSIIM